MKLASSGIVLTISLALGAGAIASDWPQFRGPDRSGVSKETGLLKSWPEAGPSLVWRVEGLGEGHSTPSVAAGHIFGMGLLPDGEYIWSLEEKTGKLEWKTKIAEPTQLNARQGGYGPRSTPTYDGTHLYALGVGGELICVESASGKLAWKHNLVSEYGGRVPTWGYCESPLVDGNQVIATPGGQQTLVAFNKKSGDVIWKCAVPDADAAAYSSAALATIGGVKQYVQFLARGIVGVSGDGKFLWRFNSPANNRGIQCAMPVVVGDYVFGGTAYQHGGALGKITNNGGTFTAQEVYFTRSMQNHHGGMVVIGNYLYGFNERMLTCLDFKTGEVKWENQSVGKGSVTFADGHLIARSERGPVALVEATPNGYVQKGMFSQPDRSMAPSWPYPVVSNGKLLLRDQGLLLCYDVKGGAASVSNQQRVSR